VVRDADCRPRRGDPLRLKIEVTPPTWLIAVAAGATLAIGAAALYTAKQWPSKAVTIREATGSGCLFTPRFARLSVRMNDRTPSGMVRAEPVLRLLSDHAAAVAHARRQCRSDEQRGIAPRRLRVRR